MFIKENLLLQHLRRILRSERHHQSHISIKLWQDCITNWLISGRMFKIEFRVENFFLRVFTRCAWAATPPNSLNGWLSQTSNLITDNPITSPQRHEWEGKQRRKFTKILWKNRIGNQTRAIDEKKSKNGIVVLSWRRIHFEKRGEKNETNYGLLETDAIEKNGNTHRAV